ncbi:enoyl-CoA hydratase/isomerase family protein [Verticiella sediminum]|uniref:Enoyl-CoA hydratase/isomerase family protein n=2 Tax=Verticiella sediminum TaxID=1247510 RepID=A0A556AJR6_9BURK|nr:enoyl-CoA hydratase/isomerase family protein [Verticiella sediminum]
MPTPSDSHASSTGLVTLAKKDGLAVLTLNRPDKLNALSSAMRAEFGRHLQTIQDDPGIRVVLLQAAGRAFCVGADNNDMPSAPFAWRERIMTAQRHHEAIVKMDKVVIASVQGAAVGGGASLALAADILVMSEDATLRFPFVRLGLIPDGGCAHLLRSKLGVPAALDLMLTGGSLDAGEARARGLTRRVVPTDALQSRSGELAAELLKLPREALMLTKSINRHGWHQAMAGALAHEADAFALASVVRGQPPAASVRDGRG